MAETARKIENADAAVDDVKSGADARGVLEREDRMHEIVDAIREKIGKSEDTYNPLLDRNAFYLPTDRLTYYEGRVARVRDIEQALRLQAQFEKEAQEVQRRVHDYFSRLEQRADLFARDSSGGVDTLQEYKTDFIAQDSAGRQKYLLAVDREIESLQALRDELHNLVGASPVHEREWSRLRRHEKRDAYLPALRNNIAAYEKTLERLQLKPEEKQQKMALFRDSTLDQQKRLFAELIGKEKDATAPKNADTKQLRAEFTAFSKERQGKYPNFAHLSAETQRDAIAALREELREAHRMQIGRSVYFSAKDKAEAEKSIKGTFDIATVEMLVATFDTCEAAARRAVDAFNGYPQAIRMQYDWENMTYMERKETLPELRQHMELVDTFDKKLAIMVRQKFLPPQSMKGYRASFLKLKLADKRSELAHHKSLDRPERKELMKRFNDLPPAVRKEFQARFWNANITRRREMLAGVEAERTVLDARFDAKLDEAVRNELVARKSAKAYREWYRHDLSMAEKRRMLVRSDLDKPQRKTVRDAFRKLPPDIQLKHKREFLEQDLEGRIALLRRISPDRGAQLREALSRTHKVEEMLDAQGRTQRIADLYDLANQFAEREHLDAALHIFDEILRLDPVQREIVAAERRRLETSAAAAAGNNYMFELALAAAAEEERDNREKLTLLSRMQEMKKRAETRYAAQNVEDATDNALRGEDERMQTLSDELREQTGRGNETMHLVKEHGGSVRAAEESTVQQKDLKETQHVRDLREFVKKHEGGPDRAPAHIKLERDEGGELSADAFARNVLEPMETELLARVVDRAERILERRRGGSPLSPRAPLRNKDLEKAAEKRDFSVEIKK